MTEKEMIEEMAKVIAIDRYNNVSSLDTATMLYEDLGYRKIPEGSVVLSRKEHIQMLKDCIQSNILVEESTRKRTAEDILSLAIAHDNGYETDMTRFISALKKKYGVEE